MCQLTTIFSGAVSFGVLAGVLTGIFYAVSAGLQWLCKVRLSLEEEAIKSRRGDGLLSERRCINCSNRNGFPALEEFTIRNGSPAIESGNGLQSRRTSRNLPGEMDVSPVSQTEESSDSTVEIREKIEKLVEKIVGGSLDGVSVGKLSNHSSYLAMFAKHHGSLCQGLASLHFSLFSGNGFEQESPKAALAALKSSIEKIVEEAVKLPEIKEIIQAPNSAEDTGVESDFSNKSYEDILATAILNKIIEQSQKRKDKGNVKKNKRTFVRRRKNGNNNNNNNNVEDENDFVYNSDWSDTSRSEQLSLTIEEHIEEITTTYENSDEEEVNDEINFNSAIHFPELGRRIWNGDNGDDENSDEGQDHSSATEIVASANSWEENWLFQKKKLRSRPNSHHPVPVPMLVPNPSKDFRALIGGVDADDLSDMSECSDSVLEDVVLAGEEKEEVAAEVYEPANGIVKIGEVEGGSSSLESELSCQSLSQKERDVSIDYEYSQKMDVDLSDGLVRTGYGSSDSSATEEKSEPAKCQIAEREKKKWNHPVPLADNPYSAENIKKREKRKKIEYFRTGCHIETSVEFPSGSPDEIAREPRKEMYSRDYYVKASRYPAGDPALRTDPVVPEETFQEVSEYLAKAGNYKGRRDFLCLDNLFEEPAGEETLPEPKAMEKWSFGGSSSYGNHSLRITTVPKKKRNLLPERSELAYLEHKSLHEDTYHIVFRAKGASPNFVVNPLFDENDENGEGKVASESPDRNRRDAPSLERNGSVGKGSGGQESGYGSDSHSSDSLEFWRLTPPETPEMLESSLITAYELRKGRKCRGNRFYGTFPKCKRHSNF